MREPNQTKRNLQVQTEIQGHFDGIMTECGYVHDHCYNLIDKPDVARKLGREVYDYLVASTNDMNWEGFSTSELTGIAALLRDLRISIVMSK